MPKFLEDIAQQLSKLTVLDAAKLVKKLEEEWGVRAAAPERVMAVATPVAEDVAEKTEFDVTLIEVGADKIGVIKALRSLISGLQLADAQNLTKSVPAKIKEGVTKEEAQKIQKTLEDVGAKVEIK